MIKIAPAAGDDSAKKKKGKEAKKAGADALSSEIRKAVLKTLNGSKAADLALFGRMLADLPDHNVNAASQVAHVLSTNKASMKFDFYTAVDDLRPDDSQGSDMLGTVEFNSACFYRYANVDTKELSRNLGGDKELTYKTIEAFIKVAVTAVPTGKQNSMAAHNPPSFVLVVAREAGMWSLANAFIKPVRPTRENGVETDLVDNSIKALDNYWGKLMAMYDDGQIRGKWVATPSDTPLKNLDGGAKVSGLKEIAERKSGAG